MREKIEQGIDYFNHRYAELENDRWLEQGKPDFMNTTDLHKQAMEEAIDQTIKGLSEEIEKGLLTDEEMAQVIEKGKPYPRHIDIAQAQVKKILALLK